MMESMHAAFCRAGLVRVEEGRVLAARLPALAVATASTHDAPDYGYCSASC